MGLSRTSLLVIPDHHHRGDVASDPALCDWLRACAAEGHEIVTHGYFHLRPQKRQESVVQKLTTNVYTAGEGEFFDLSQADAEALVQRGNAELRQLGLAPRGFIAPAWLLSTEAETALRQIGCSYTTRLRTVHDLQTGAVHDSQSLCWSVRAAWRRAMSVVWNAALYRRLEKAPLLRISVHPVDIDHPRIWQQIRGLIADALRQRTATTYADWIDTTRQSSIIDKEDTLPATPAVR